MSAELIVGRVFDIAVDEVLSETVKRVMSKRTAEVRECLVEDLRTAGISIEEAAARDDVVAMMITLIEALRQGAATRNLRIIARVLADKAAHPERGTEDFIAWADSIKALTQQEIAYLLTHWRQYTQMTINDVPAGSDPLKATRDAVVGELVGNGRLLGSTQEYEMYGYSLLRTGFLTMVSIMGPCNCFVPTDRLSRLVEIAKLNEWAEGELLHD